VRIIGAAFIAAGLALSIVLGYLPAIGNRRPPTGPFHETADFQATMPVWQARIIAAGMVVIGGSLVVGGFRKRRGTPPG